MGIVYEIEMKIVPEFQVKRCIYKDVSWISIFEKSNFDFMNYVHDYISMFTDWSDKKMTSIWMGEILKPKDEVKEFD